MKINETHETIDVLKYFCFEREPDRWDEWEEFIERNPTIKIAYENYIAHKNIFEDLIRNLEPTQE